MGPTGRSLAGPGRKKKDKDAPKKARTAYIFFSMECRAKARAEGAQISFIDLSKEIGEKWRDMEAGVRQKYLDLSSKDQEEYAEAMKEYRAAKQNLEGGASEVARQAAALKRGMMNADNNDNLWIMTVAASSEIAAASVKQQEAAGGALGGGGGGSRSGGGGGGVGGGGVVEYPNTSATDIAWIKAGLASVARDEAYYMVVDAMRQNSAAVREASQYLVDARPDWKAFLIHVLGYQAVINLLK